MAKSLTKRVTIQITSMNVVFELECLKIGQGQLEYKLFCLSKVKKPILYGRWADWKNCLEIGEKMRKINYFAYGSNMNLDRMEERLCDFHNREELVQNRKRAILRGWRLEFNKKASSRQGMGYVNIVKTNNGVVEGCLYRISEEAFERLNVFEGVPNHYQVIEVEVETHDGKVKAKTYIANPNKVEEDLRPSRDYLEHLLKGEECLSNKYIKKLKAVKTL